MTLIIIFAVGMAPMVFQIVYLVFTWWKERL